MKLKMEEKYLDKTYCEKLAGDIIWENKWDQVSRKQLAKEIYGHAFVYYKWSVMKHVPLVNKLVYAHAADGIDLDNKVDRFQAVWEVVWNLCFSQEHS